MMMKIIPKSGAHDCSLFLRSVVAILQKIEVMQLKHYPAPFGVWIEFQQ